MTGREFTLALAHKACLLVRHSGSQRHLIMAIAHSTALHTFSLTAFNILFIFSAFVVLIIMC